MRDTLVPYTAERICLVKNTTRAAALVAAAALASSGATGVANAQSGDFEIPILGGLTTSADISFPDMGSTDLGSMELIPGSAGVIPEGSTGGIGEGSTELGGSADFTGSGGIISDGLAGSLEGGSVTTVIDSVSGSVDNLSGSSTGLSGSLGDFTTALTGSISDGGSLTGILDGVEGSLGDGGSLSGVLTGVQGSITGGSLTSIIDGVAGSLDDGGSLTGVLAGVEGSLGDGGSAGDITTGVGGSLTDIGTGITGSLGDGGSAGDITTGLQGSIENGGSLESITDGFAGSIDDGGSVAGILAASEGSIANLSGSLTDPDTGLLGSVTGGELTQGIVGSLDVVTNSLAGPDTGLLGSLTGNGGSTGQSSDAITTISTDSAYVGIGSAEELTGVNGSLTAFTGSLENGSLQGTASADNGSLRATASTDTASGVGTNASLESVTSIESSVGGGLLPILSVGGAIALGGAAVGAGVGADLRLPPLPGVHLPTICDLPHDMVDQLANSGSGIADQECYHPEREGN